MKLLLYCTKAKPYLRDYRGKAIYNRFVISPTDRPFTSDDTQPILNGKIVAECDFEVEELMCDNYEDARDDYVGYFHALPKDDFEEGEKELQKKSCLDELQINGYLQEHNGYAIHIKNLNIFDEPRELREYYNNNSNHIEKAPQNMMYARQTMPFKNEFLVKGILQEVRGYKVNEYVLISIQPQWMCLILNRIKDVEVRKVVLKEMLKND